MSTQETLNYEMCSPGAVRVTDGPEVRIVLGAGLFYFFFLFLIGSVPNQVPQEGASYL